MKRLRSFRKRERGDTLIEVLLAMGMLGVLITITYTSMTRSMAVAYNSLDRTNTQAMMNGQANILRAIHSERLSGGGSPTLWDSIESLAITDNDMTEEVSDAAREDGCTFGGRLPEKRFYIDPTSNPLALRLGSDVTITNVRDTTVSGGPQLGNGLWIEAYKLTPRDGGGISDEVYTFYIKACTPPIYGDGSEVPRQTTSVVRLYAEQ